MKSDPLLIKTLSKMKTDYEDAIISGGRDGVHSLIRSQKLINYIHEYVKMKLINEGIDPSKMYPPLNASKPELKMCGFLKKKDQDICVLPKPAKKCIIEEGVLLGDTDDIGKDIMDISLSINVRSQLSSLAKNFDTLFERTFAESLNLHLRSPMLVTGEVYMVPLVAYDPKSINENKISWGENLPLTRYIPAFRAINNRKSAEDDLYKYERVALLIVDFTVDPPVEINSVKYLIDNELIEPELEDRLSLKGLDLSNFVPDILNIYKERHGSIEPLKNMCTLFKGKKSIKS